MRQETARANAAVTTEGKVYARNIPKCNRCNLHHHGPCPPKCQRCQRICHMEKDCRARLPGAGQNPNVVTGTFLLIDHYACILFDSGAKKSFVSSAFTPFIDIAPAALNTSYEVELADGKVISTNTILRSCTLVLFNHVFKIDLLPTRLGSFYVIIRMDWLAYHRSVIDCYEKIICISLPNGEILEVQGERPEKDSGSLACIKVDEKKLDDIRVVRDRQLHLGLEIDKGNMGHRGLIFWRGTNFFKIPTHRQPAIAIHHTVTIRQLDVPIPWLVVSIPQGVMDNNHGSRAAALFNNLEEGGSRDIIDDDHENDKSLNSLQDRVVFLKRIYVNLLALLLVNHFVNNLLADAGMDMMRQRCIAFNCLMFGICYLKMQDWRKVGIVSSEESRIMWTLSYILYHGLQAVSIGRLKVLIEYLEAVIGTQASVYPLAVGHTIDSLSIFPSAYYVQWRSYEEIGEGYGPPTTLSHSVNAYPPILRNFDMSEREKETPSSQVKGVFDDLSAEHLPLVSSHEHVISSKEREPSDKVPVEPVSVLVEKSSAKPVPPPVSRHLGAPLAEGSRPTASAGTTTTLVVSMN
ncbi:putative reverse transcriptase domain-containing protein [Tanacetum coccineum]